MPPSSSPAAPLWSLPAITTSFLRSGMSTNRSAGSTMPFSGSRSVRSSHDCSPRDGPMPSGSCISMNRSIRSGTTSAMRMRAMPVCALITFFSIPRRHSGWQAPASIETYAAGKERAITNPPGWRCGTSDPSRPWRATATEFNGYGQARASERRWTMPTRILVKTTIGPVMDDWHVGRFSLLIDHLRSLRDSSGAVLYDVAARDRSVNQDGDDTDLVQVARGAYDQLWLIGADETGALTTGD